MNRFIKGLAGGATGAITVTLLHEILRRYYPGAPRLDKLGEEAVSKTIEAAGGDAPAGDELYAVSMLADVVSNTWYYSAAAASKQYPVEAGLVLGVLAGAGAVALPGPLGLDPETTAGSLSRKLITFSLYTLGGAIAGALIKKLSADDFRVS